MQIFHFETLFGLVCLVCITSFLDSLLSVRIDETLATHSEVFGILIDFFPCSFFQAKTA